MATLAPALFLADGCKPVGARLPANDFERAGLRRLHRDPANLYVLCSSATHLNTNFH